MPEALSLDLLLQALADGHSRRRRIGRLGRRLVGRLHPQRRLQRLQGPLLRWWTDPPSASLGGLESSPHHQGQPTAEAQLNGAALADEEHRHVSPRFALAGLAESQQGRFGSQSPVIAADPSPCLDGCSFSTCEALLPQMKPASSALLHAKEHFRLGHQRRRLPDLLQRVSDY
jgi:hypothetical protein